MFELRSSYVMNICFVLQLTPSEFDFVSLPSVVDEDKPFLKIKTHIHDPSVIRCYTLIYANSKIKNMHI